nr:hypothetical protein Iba_chr11fCG5640 [Ipomoea batatas]
MSHPTTSLEVFLCSCFQYQYTIFQGLIFDVAIISSNLVSRAPLSQFPTENQNLRLLLLVQAVALLFFS